MNDIEKLHQVIDVLEEQSARVIEFNGILSAVNSASEKIDLTRATFADLINEQKKLVSESYSRFDQYGVQLAKLETQVTSLTETQQSIFKAVETLDFVTPEQHSRECSNIEKIVKAQIHALTDKIDLSSAAQQSSLKSVKKLLIFELILLIIGVAFLAKTAIS